MLNPTHLKTLVTVIRTGSFASAARQLGYTGSAVSQQIAGLEREVDMSLFERYAHGIRPTPAGEYLATHAQDVLSAISAFEDEVQEMTAGTLGRVRFGSFPSASQQLLPLAMSRFIRTNPQVEILLDEGEPDQLVPQLVARELDLALVYHYDLMPQAWPRSLKSRRLLSEDLTLLLPPRHRLIGHNITIQDLSNETWISTGVHTSGSISLRRLCAAAGFEPSVHYRSNDYSVVRGFVQSGLGIALVPTLSHVDVEDVSTASVAGLTVRRHVLALYPPTTSNPAVQGAVNALVAASDEICQTVPGLAAHS